MSSEIVREPEGSAIEPPIRTRRSLHCIVCGRTGIAVRGSVTDQLFGVPGEWLFKRCPDRSCGLIWLDPLPIEDDIDRAYAGYYTHDDRPQAGSRLQGLYYRAASRMLRARRRSRPLAEFPMLYMPRRVTWRVLEIGFGDGAALQALNDAGWEATGLETDPVAVERARERGLDVRLGSLEEQAYPDGYFDAVISNHVLEHVHDPVALLHECRRILRPGGRCIAATPNAHSLGHRVFGSSWRGLEPPRHLHIFTAPALRAITRAAGFRQADVAASTRGAAVIWGVSQRLHRRKRSRRDTTDLREMLTEPTLQGMAVEAFESLFAPIAPGLAEEIILLATR